MLIKTTKNPNTINKLRKLSLLISDSSFFVKLLDITKKIERIIINKCKLRRADNSLKENPFSARRYPASGTINTEIM